MFRGGDTPPHCQSLRLKFDNQQKKCYNFFVPFISFQFIGGFFTEIVQKKRHRVKDVVFALQISTYILDSAPFFLFSVIKGAALGVRFYLHL